MSRLSLALFLSLGCGAAASAPATTPAAATSGPRASRGEVAFRELAPGVWMHSSEKVIAPWGPVVTNGLVVVVGESATLVDTAWDDAQTGSIVAWAESELGHPIARAVFTHAHDDKMGGVAALRQAGIATWAAADTNALARERGLTPAEFTLHFDESAISRELAPLVVFDPGGAHTEDNIVVGLPDADLVFGGCMIRPPGATTLGNTADANVAHWDEAVEATAARFSGAIVVPSHGPPAGRELFSLTVRLVREHRANDAD